MNKRGVSVLMLMCLVLLICMTVATQDVQAQSADQKLAAQDGSLPTKELDASKLPGKLEYGLVIGSIIAMIGVIKFV